MVIKLHLFSGFENKELGITRGMEIGHLYEDTNSFAILTYAVDKIGIKEGWVQNNDGFIHFDLWGAPLEKAKRIFNVVSDEELAKDMEAISKKRKRRTGY